MSVRSHSSGGARSGLGGGEGLRPTSADAGLTELQTSSLPSGCATCSAGDSVFLRSRLPVFTKDKFNRNVDFSGARAVADRWSAGWQAHPFADNYLVRCLAAWLPGQIATVTWTRGAAWRTPCVSYQASARRQSRAERGREDIEGQCPRALPACSWGGDASQPWPRFGTDLAARSARATVRQRASTSVALASQTHIARARTTCAAVSPTVRRKSNSASWPTISIRLWLIRGTR